MFILLKSR